MSVKWLRSIKVTSMPAMTKDETSKYSDLRDDGYADLFTYPMAVKSVITNPSPGLSLYEKGIYQINGFLPILIIGFGFFVVSIPSL